jgi:hypothetical protein
MANNLPFAVFEMKEYMVIFRQLEEREIAGTTVQIRALVRCSGTGVDNSAEYRLDVYFLGLESDFPEPQVNLEERHGAMFMPMEDLPIFVDVLRNEKPIFGHLRGDNPQLTSITTSNEPIGAGDEDD